MSPPPAAPPAPRLNDYTLGILAYVLAIFLSWIGPLVIFLVTRKEDTFNRRHAMQALLLTLIQFIVTAPLWLSLFLPSLAWRPFPGPGDVGEIGAFFAFAALFGLVSCGLTILFVVLFIVGAIKASKGEEFRLGFVSTLAAKWA